MEPIEDLEKGRFLVDGGVARAVDIASAINYCKDQGFSEDKIVVDIVLNNGATFNVKDTSNYNTLQHGLRYVAIRQYYKAMDVTVRAKAAAPKAEFRFTIAPTKKLETGTIPFHFDPVEIEHNIQTGMDDAKAAITAGSGKNLKDLIDYTDLKARGKTKLDFGEYLTAQE